MAAPPIPSEAAQAVLTIDLSALVANWRTLAAIVAPAECAAVVKADAYGTGLERAVAALADAGCRTFFVAHVSEGARARETLGTESGARIYVLNGLASASSVGLFLEHRLRPVLGSLAQAATWIEACGGAASPAALQIDTGMNRLGLAPSELADFALIRGAPVDHVMSHMVSSEEPRDAINDRQIAAFATARAAFPQIGASLANSSAIFLPSKPFFDLVRPGYALYGGNPTPGARNPMRPVVRLDAPILALRSIAAGETVGYNAQWTARRPTRLATIGVGYADGLPRALMATDARFGGEALVAGVRCPFAGRVSMDLTVIDVTGVPAGEVAVGVMAELLGDTIGVDDMGARAGSIGYEVLTNLGRRYHRRHIAA